MSVNRKRDHVCDLVMKLGLVSACTIKHANKNRRILVMASYVQFLTVLASSETLTSIGDQPRVPACERFLPIWCRV